MRSLLITYDLQPPWDRGLKVYGRGLMNALRNIDGIDLDTIHTIDDIQNYRDYYDYVHVMLIGFRPFMKSLRFFKRAKIFKHIVTPSVGFMNALSARICYSVVDRLEDRLVRCFSSEFVAKSYFMSGGFVIPPSIDTTLFVKSDQKEPTKVMECLNDSPMKSGINNVKDLTDGLLFYSGPLTEDRFPYRKVLDALREVRSNLLIVGRPTNSGAVKERVAEIISYARKINIDNRVTIALKLLNEDEKISLLNFSDVIIQPFAKVIKHYVAIDPPIFLLEAMACGKPVITSKTHSFDSFIKNGYNGYTIDWDNSDELNEALLGCQSTELGMNARQTVLNKFSCNSVSAKLTQMYHDHN